MRDCPFVVLSPPRTFSSLPFSFHFYPLRPYNIESGLDIQDYHHLLLLIPLAIPRPIKEAPPYLEGVSRTPPHDLIAGSWEAGMASVYMAPECTLGMGAAEKSAVWHDVTAGEWSVDFSTWTSMVAGSISGSQTATPPPPQAPPLGRRRPQRGQKQNGD